MSNLEKLKRFLSLFKSSSKVLIVINADPDAIASAMAVKRLLWRKVAEVSIAYFKKSADRIILPWSNILTPGW